MPGMGRLRWPVDVCVEHAHTRAFGRQRECQVRGRGALAHAALARCHRDDVLDARDQLHAALHGVRHHLAGDADAHVARARQCAELGQHLLPDRVELALARVTEFDVEGHVVAGDLDVFRRTSGDEILAGVRIDQFLEGGLDLGFAEGHGVGPALGGF